MFDKDNRIRILFVDIADSNYFEFFIVLMIVLATIALSIENPLDNPDSKKTAILKYSNYFFTFFFFSEAVIKIVALGLYFNGKLSYLKSYWNVLDFFIVVCSILDVVAGRAFRFLQVFRLVRAMRPLKMITKTQGFKIILKSLLLSLSDIIRGLLISFIFFFIFAIIYVNLLKGTHNKCQQDDTALKLVYYESNF